MRGHFLGLLIGAIALGVSASVALAETRIALVIGNSNYQHTGILPNPANDAELLAGVLSNVGFQVTKQIDASRDQMQQSMLAFGRALRQPNTVGLFFYAGHGLQVNGFNYLVPVDADIASEDEVGIRTVPVNEFLQTLDSIGGRDGRMNIVVLDACRNNPFARGWRSAVRGLAPIDAPSGTLIAFSTAPGDVASDGKDGNSPYAKGLAKAIMQKGLQVEETFKTTRTHVLAATSSNKKPQTPWEQSSLTGQFYFVPGDATAPTGAASSQDEVEVAFWNSVQDSKQRADFEAYLRSFPSGKFAELARARLTTLTSAASIFAETPKSLRAPGVRELIDPSQLPSDPPDYSASHGVMNTDQTNKPGPLINP